MKTIVKKNPTTVASTSKETSIDKSPQNEIDKEQTPSKSPIKLDITQNILGYLKLDYDVVEDLKKMKENIIVFELCKITQLREQLYEALQHIHSPQDVAIGNSKDALKGNNIEATKSSKTSSVSRTSSVENKENTTIDEKKPDLKEDMALIERK